MAPSISTTQHSYTLSGLLSSPPHRLDGRSLLAYRPLHLATGTAPQAAGSAECVLGGSKCLVVVSADIVEGKEASGPYFSCDVDCHSSIPQGTNLSSLLLTLNKTLAAALASTDFSANQFIVLRSASPPHAPTKAWSLHLDVTFVDIQGGNLADVMFAAVWAALNDVRLPRTRAIGFDTDLLNKRQTEGNLDSFDIKGSLARTRRAAPSLTQTQESTSFTSTSGSTALDPALKEKTGVDFEIVDVWDGGLPIQGCHDFPVAVTINLIPSGVLLDATLGEEVCFTVSRRLLVLCTPSTGKLSGLQMITPTLDTGISKAGEDVRSEEATFTGTADYKFIRQAIQDGESYARGLHGVIQSQMAASRDTEMQVV